MSSWDETCSQARSNKRSDAAVATTEKAKHTSGAMRSAKAIWELEFASPNGCTQQTFADIIDDETASPEMLSALERCASMLRDEHRGYHGEVFVYDEPKACCEMGNAIVAAEAAIRRAKGE